MFSPEKGKKVKNVIKGYAGRYDIEEITVFDTAEEDSEKIVYSGSFERFMNTKEEDEIIYKEWKRIMNADCRKCLGFNFFTKIFIFI